MIFNYKDEKGHPILTCVTAPYILQRIDDDTTNVMLSSLDEGDMIILETGRYIERSSIELISCQDLLEYPIDELCIIHNYLLSKASDAFHESDNQKAGYLTLICDKYMSEIKDRILHCAI